MNERTHVDLFSGLGGFALAARSAGIRTVQFCEIDQRCRDFLRRAWPGVPVWDDVRTLWVAHPGVARENARTAQLRTRNGSFGEPTGIYLLTAGVPCQPASRAGKQRGAADDRWLWPEALRVLSEVRPTWALFENPPGIGDVGLAGILAGVEATGYEVSVIGLPACAVGAPHQRMRYWIVGRRMEDSARDGLREVRSQPWADRKRAREAVQRGVADTEATTGVGLQNRKEHEPSSSNRRRNSNQWGSHVWLPCADGKFRRAPDDSFGLVDGLHRSVLGALGNSIIPQVAGEIMKAMVKADEVCRPLPLAECAEVGR